MKKITPKLVPAKMAFVDSRAETKFKANSVHLVGLAFDGTSCFRKGADKGPAEIRKSSDNIEDYSPYLDKSVRDIPFYDLGDIRPDKDWKSLTAFYAKLTKNLKLADEAIRLITMGGEHSVSFMPIARHLEEYPDLFLIQLDAHADLRDGYLGNKFSHASVMFRVMEIMKEGHELVQYGIRSGTRDEFHLMKESGTLLHSLDALLGKIESLPDSRPIYLTLDIDFFDPAFVPGTGTPEAGGETFASFLKINAALSKKNFIGCDVVELAPPLDPTGNSSCFASKVIRELALSLNLRSPGK